MPSTCARRDGTGLRELLLGPPLSAREDGIDPTALRLDAAVRGLPPLVRTIYGDGPAAEQACAELERIAALPMGSADHAHCKRAALLFALRKEPEVQRHYAGDPFARDMAARVLPLLTPRFLKHSCQAPEAYVRACVALAELWEGEPIGNWPLERGGGGGNGGGAR